MKKLKRFRTTHPVIILFLGLIIAQIIAAIQVYLSNLDLYKTLSDVSSAGYLAIPNKHVMGSLRELGPAFWGGLFFTLTIGVGISLGAMASAWIWVRMFVKKRSILVFFLFIWAGMLILVNSNGFSLMPTLYFLVIAPVVFSLSAERASMTDIQSNRIRRLVSLIPVPLLALLWFTQFDNQMFLDLRDNLLLSNNYGRKFSHFYYTYTLYPAEAFKALSQKTIKTASINNIQTRSTVQRIGMRLTASDYLPLSDASDVDLVINQINDHLVLQTDSRQVLQTPIDQFLTDFRQVLQKFSEECDHQAIFRQLTFLSLLVGFPVFLYMILHAALYYPGYIIFGKRTSALTAPIICLLIGILVLVYFQSNRSRNIQVQNISNALISDHWQTRVAALQLIAQKKLEIASFRTYPDLLKHKTPQERYWLARTLAVSRRPDTFRDLLELLNDDNLNVRTMAFYSLGLRKDPRAIKPILSKIEKSDNWYEQLYAYKALRSLGWKQTRSP
jgi:hypothetical protein